MGTECNLLQALLITDKALLVGLLSKFVSLQYPNDSIHKEARLYQPNSLTPKNGTRV